MKNNDLYLENKSIGAETINIGSEILNMGKLVDKVLTNSQKVSSKMEGGARPVGTFEETLSAFKVRSEVFGKAFGGEFKDPIPGLNYTPFDDNSIVLVTSDSYNKINGTTTVALDGKKGLPSDIYFDKDIGLNEIRQEYNEKGLLIAESTRSAVLPEFRKGYEFFHLMDGIAQISKILGIGAYIASTTREIFNKAYSPFGAEIIKELPKYGNIEDCVVIKVDPEKSRELLHEIRGVNSKQNAA